MLKNKKIQVSAVKDSFFTSVMARWLGVLCFLVSVSFFLQTYDSATVKLSLFYAGAAGLGGLWIASLIKERANIFTSKNFILFLPFIFYFSYIIINFFLTPYPLVRWESLTRFILSAVVFSVIVFELTPAHIYKIISAMIFACWFVYGYGLVQVLNNTILPGIDPLFWSGFFGNRVFSTIANPNFFGDFCLFTLVLILSRWLLTRQKSLLILAAAGFVNIAWTESKGAWAALAVSIILFAFIYLNYFAAVYKKHRAKFNIIAVCIIIAATFAVGVFAAKRMQSVNFRLSTWRATLDMVQAKPLIGTGKGSYEIIYPSYKRPEIFYMENLHNAQTQHAEDYYLETWAEIGLFGFALFLLCCFIVIKAVFAKLKTFDDTVKENKAEFYTLLGCFGAAAAIYIHNFVDVSIYFVSTGLFLTVFNAATVNLALGRGEKITKPQASSYASKYSYIFAAATALVCFFIAAAVYKSFYFMTATLLDTKPLIFFICWAFVIFCVLGAAAVFTYAAFKAKSAAAAVVLCLSAGLMYFGWGFMRVDNYLALAGKLAEANDVNAARYYTQMLAINSFDAETLMHRGMVFAERLDLTPSNSKFYGDAKDKLFDDYQRALRDYNASLQLSPNSVLIYYNLGALQRNTAVKLARSPEYQTLPSVKAQVADLYAAAEKNLKLALLTDPVYDNIYYQLANISFDKGDFKTAYYWLLKYIKGPEGVVNQEYLNRHSQNEKALKYLNFAKERLSPQEIKETEAKLL